MIDVLSLITTIAMICGAICGAATRCPPGWYVNGVRPTGWYECRPVLGDPDRDVDDARAQVEIRDDRRQLGVIYCTGGQHPIVVDDRTVGCQR